MKKIFVKSFFAVLALLATVTTVSAQNEWMNPDEWVEVTPDMWHQWGSKVDPTHCKGDAVITGDMTPAWNLNADIGAGSTILGAENVSWNLYADLSDYDKLIIFGTGGPGMRIMCNRIIDEGAWKNLVVGFNADDSHWNKDLECLVIDLSEIKTMTCTANGEGDAEGVKTGDQRVDDFVHLHCFKNAWGGEFPIGISAMYLWKGDGGVAGGSTTPEIIESENIYFPSDYRQYYYDSDTIVGMKSKIVLSSNPGSSTPYNYYGIIRFYPNNSIKFMGGDNIITDITFNSSDYVMDFTPDSGTMDGNHWTGMANEVSFVNNTGSQKRFESITIDYLVSKEAMFDQLTQLVASADEVLANIVYANVPGKVELAQLLEVARTTNLDDENVDAIYLKNLCNQIQKGISDVLALDNEYQHIATEFENLASIANNNSYVDTKLVAEMENYKTEVTNGMAQGAYNVADIPVITAAINQYAARFSYLHLDINVPVPGAMGDSILAKVENFSDVQSLRLTGKLNSTDMERLKSGLYNIRALDLSGLDWTSIPDEQFRDMTNMEYIILPNNLQSIGNYAFYNCQNLKPIVFPATLRTIGRYAFYQTYNIGDVVLPEGLSSMGDYAFNISGLTSVTFPSTLKTISYEAFAYCYYLKDITFNGQTSINNYAFRDCDALVSVKFPETLQSIGYAAFSYCDRLINIEFNEGLTDIGNECFYGCNAIESVTLPSSLQTLNGYYAFRYCDNLKQVTCKAIVPPYTDNGNITGKSGLDLYVPQLSVNVYKQTSGWDQFNIHGINVMPDNITVQSEYKLNWPDSLNIDYKPNVTITDRDNSQYGSLIVTGNSTLSAGQFTMEYAPNISYNNSYWDSERQEYYRNRYSYTSLVNEAKIRADHVTMELWLRANTWEFLTFPYDIKVSDIRLAFEGTPFVIRKYDGEKRAAGLTSETWVNMTADSTLHAGTGYIWRSASTDRNRYYTGFYLDALQTVNKNNIFINDNVEVPLNFYESEFEHNRSWNLIGNPYPCFYDTRAMLTSAPITVWDTYQNNYRAYSPQDDKYILNPGQAFFVQRPVNEESITFLKEGRQTNLTVRDVTYNRASARANSIVERSVFNVVLSNDKQSDRTRFVINGCAKMDYESARDASKFMALDHPVMQLYTIDGNVRYSINERPLGEGVISLGIQITEEGMYTISLDTKVENEVYIVDHLTGTEVRLDGNSYSFHSEVGTFDARFSIRLGGGDTTGIKAIEDSPVSNDVYYDLSGRRISKTQKGVYVKNGKKVVVK